MLETDKVDQQSYTPPPEEKKMELCKRYAKPEFYVIFPPGLPSTPTRLYIRPGCMGNGFHILWFSD